MIQRKKKIAVNNLLPAYKYMGYMHEAIKRGEAFKYSEINQLGARLSGKTTSDNIELVRAIVIAAKTKQKSFILILRMRHKDVNLAWEDIIRVLDMFNIPYRTWAGRNLIRIWTTKIQVKGCYTTNSNEISFLGFNIPNAKYGVVVFEEENRVRADTRSRSKE